MSPAWEAIKDIYYVGLVLSAIVTFFLTRDPSLSIRFFTAKLIGLTWPMSLPVVLLFSLF